MSRLINKLVNVSGIQKYGVIAYIVIAILLFLIISFMGYKLYSFIGDKFTGVSKDELMALVEQQKKTIEELRKQNEDNAEQVRLLQSILEEERKATEELQRKLQEQQAKVHKVVKRRNKRINRIKHDKRLTSKQKADEISRTNIETIWAVYTEVVQHTPAKSPNNKPKVSSP